MTETMIERVAAAIEASKPMGDWPTLEQVHTQARAAIEAMREPTEAMSLAGIKRNIEWEYGDRGDADLPPHISEDAAFTAMIDAALREEPK